MESLGGSIKEKVTKVMTARKQLASMYGEKIKNLEYESGGGQSSGRAKEQMYQCYIQDLNDQVDMLIALLAASEQKVCDLCGKSEGGSGGQSRYPQNPQCCKPMCCKPCGDDQSPKGRGGSRSSFGRHGGNSRNGKNNKLRDNFENDLEKEEEDTPVIGIRIYSDSGSQTALSAPASTRSSLGGPQRAYSSNREVASTVASRTTKRKSFENELASEDEEEEESEYAEDDNEEEDEEDEKINKKDDDDDEEEEDEDDDEDGSSDESSSGGSSSDDDSSSD